MLFVNSTVFIFSTFNVSVKICNFIHSVVYCKRVLCIVYSSGIHAVGYYDCQNGLSSRLSLTQTASILTMISKFKTLK